MFDTRADQERAAQQPPVIAKPRRPRLTCPGHVWGDWMRDVIAISLPDRTLYAMAPDTHYRRFCRRCKAERKGRGTADGKNIEETYHV